MVTSCHSSRAARPRYAVAASLGSAQGHVAVAATPLLLNDRPIAGSSGRSPFLRLALVMARCPSGLTRALLFVGAVLALFQFAPLALAAPGPAVDDGATRLVQRLNPAVFVLRTMDSDQSDPQSTASGFFVRPDGLAITSYHVMSDFVRQKPSQPRRLEAVLADGQVLPVEVLGFDLLSDLALIRVRADGRLFATIRVPTADLTPEPGAVLYSFGNPKGLGISSTRGSFSGRIRKLAWDRYHVTGSIRAGMSGGPSVNARGELVGVNAARLSGAEQVGFVVPGIYAHRLVAQPVRGPFKGLGEVNAELERQLVQIQSDIGKEAFATPWTTNAFGRYRVKGFLMQVLRCNTQSAGQPDDDDDENGREAGSRVLITRRACAMEQSVAADAGLDVTGFRYAITHLQGQGMNPVRFNHKVSALGITTRAVRHGSSMEEQQCTVRSTYAGAQQQLPVRLVWCAQPYREFKLNDVRLTITTRDRADEALVVDVALEGVTWELAQRFTARLLEELE